MGCEAVRSKLCTAVAAGFFAVALGSAGALCQATTAASNDPQVQGKVETTPAPSESYVQTSPPGAQNSEVNAAEKSQHRKTHVRLGTVTVGASFFHASNGIAAYPLWGCACDPYGFGYDPSFYDLLQYESFGPPDLPNLDPAPNKGEVRLEAKPRSASVYINDAYAGTAGKLKHIWLAPGAYDLTVAANDGSEFRQRIYVLSGKSVKVRAKFAANND